MAVFREGLCFIVLLIVFRSQVQGKPLLFGSAFCDVFCIDFDDYNDNAMPTAEDILAAIFDPCSKCPMPPRSTTPSTTTVAGASPATMPPFNFMIPPSTFGFNMTLINANGTWMLGMNPYAMQGGMTTTTPATTTLSTTTTTASTTTAAAGAATTAAAAATTAAA